MKKSLIIAAVFCAAIAVSCNKNIAEEPTAPASHIFTCVLGDPDSKVDIDEQGKVTWEVGDEIYIHAGKNGSESVTMTLTSSDISADGKTATIDIGSLTGYDRTDRGYISQFFAIFPASAASTSNNMYYETRVNDLSIPPMGGYDNGENVFIFRNLCGIIRYTVSGNFDSFAFSGNNDETVTYTPDYQVRLVLQNDGSELFERTSSNGANSAAQTVSTGAVAADGSTVNYICIPGGANLSGGFTIKFKDGDEVIKIAQTDTPVNIGRNKILDLGDITSKLENYVPPTSSDHRSSISGASDLSSVQANCFVISNAGAYKFPVYKGNSDTEAGSVFGVELLWETYNNDQSVTKNSVIEAVDFDGPENYVYFKTPDTLTPGNALIAAKDSEGAIIWSWHIWIPETPFTADYFDISTQKFMSRNLGALVDTKAENQEVDARSYGFFYQWGRKDPFIGAKKYNSSSLASIAGTAKTSSTVQFTIAQSIANPTVYVNFKGDWMTPEARDLWTEEGEKSIYDPCPAGYRVPKRISNDPIWSKVNELESFDPNTDYGWWKLGTAVFPFAGYLDYSGSSVGHAYDRARIWNAHKSQEDYAYDQQIWIENGEWQSQPGWQHRTACGNTVRCVVDE